MNMTLDQKIRSVFVFAVPVGWAAWQNWGWGFLMAGIATLSAFSGGVLEHPTNDEPDFVEGLLTYVKLTAVAIGVHVGKMLGSQRGKRDENNE